MQTLSSISHLSAQLGLCIERRTHEICLGTGVFVSRKYHASTIPPHWYQSFMQFPSPSFPLEKETFKVFSLLLHPLIFSFLLALLALKFLFEISSDREGSWRDKKCFSEATGFRERKGLERISPHAHYQLVCCKCYPGKFLCNTFNVARWSTQN